KMAKDYGVPLVISTDMHVTTQLDFMAYGVSVARRGWAEKRDVLNALPFEQLIKKLTACRAGKMK
ncbi:MAG TPA: DNA polymerase III, partial [Nitrospirota bacterium]